MKPAKILYFVDGPAPTPEDFAAAADLSATVNFRNAQAVPSEPHALEICDGVAGKVPAIYAERFPDAETAIATKTAELKALTSKVGDSPAPKPKGKPAAPVAPVAPAQPAPQGWNPNPIK